MAARPGRQPSHVFCPQGAPIGKSKAVGIRAPGPCDACGKGPLHGVLAASCGCSFHRQGKRLCRRCALSYDFSTQGYSRISHDYLPEDVMEIVEMVRLGDRARGKCGI